MSVLVGETYQSPEHEDMDSEPQLAVSVRWADVTLFQSLDDNPPRRVPVNDISSLGSVIFEVGLY